MLVKVNAKICPLSSDVYCPPTRAVTKALIGGGGVHIHIFATVKAHTDRTRFGNATRILDFQCRLALIFFHFSQTFGNVLAI